MVNDTELSVEEVLEKYSDMVYRLAYARTQNKQDAEDVTQDVFMKYIRAAEHFSDEEHRKAWLLRVTINTSKSLVTSAWARHRAGMDHVPEEAYLMEEDKHDVFYVVQKLPEKYRVVIQLFYYEELSIRQIGEVLRKKESTVKSLLKRAREQIKDLLTEGMEGYV